MYKHAARIAIASLTLFVGVLSITVYSCFDNRTETSNNPDVTGASASLEAESYAVYSAVLGQVFGEKEPRTVVISNRTLFYPNSQNLGTPWIEKQIQDGKKYYPSVSGDTLTDFYLKTASPTELNSQFDLDVPYLLIDENEFGETDAALELYKRYPAGMIKFSRVGFNHSRDQAFVEVEFLFCALCGFGDKILLEKTLGIWLVKERFRGWVS